MPQQISQLQSERDALQRRVNALEKDISSLHSDLNAQKQETITANVQVESLTRALADARIREEDLHLDIGVLQNQLDVSTDLCSELKEEKEKAEATAVKVTQAMKEAADAVQHESALRGLSPMYPYFLTRSFFFLFYIQWICKRLWRRLSIVLLNWRKIYVLCWDAQTQLFALLLLN